MLRLFFSTLIFLSVLYSFKLEAKDRSVGVYIWDGLLENVEHPLVASSSLIVKNGFKSERFIFSPNSFLNYKMAGFQNTLKDPCAPLLASGTFLSCLAQEKDFVRVFSDPSLTSIMLTTYDGIVSGPGKNYGFLDAVFLLEHQDQIIKEYSDLTHLLLVTYAGTKKVFTLSNWEGDNQVYCGSAWGYATTESVKQNCDNLYKMKNFGSASSPADAFKGMKLWFELRQKGIIAGRNQFLTEWGKKNGAKDPLVSVRQSPEFNSIHFLLDHGFKSIATSSIPTGDLSPEAVSFSAYEVTNLEIEHPGTTQNYLSDLAAQLKYVRGTLEVIIGECGFGQKDFQTGPSAQTRLHTALLALEQNQERGLLSQIFIWEGFPSVGDKQFGLFNSDGTIGLLQGIKDLLSPSFK